jgi:hypothetical protein
MSKATYSRYKLPKKLAGMQTEYDLVGMGNGVRGKYYQDYRAGHTVKIHREDGTTLVWRFDCQNGDWSSRQQLDNG